MKVATLSLEYLTNFSGLAVVKMGWRVCGEF